MSTSVSHHTKRGLAALDMTLIVFAFSLLSLSNSFFPFGRDQGNYATAAWLWLEGASPYKEVLVFKPPGTLWLHAISQAAFGHNMAAIRIMDGIVHGASAITIYVLIVRWVQSRTWALFAALAYPALYFGFDDWHGAQTDSWLNASILLGFLCLQKSARPWAWLVAGAAVGVAFWLKFTYLAAAAPLLFSRWPVHSIKDLLRRAGLMSLGGTAFSCLVILSLYIDGGLSDFWIHSTKVLPSYASLSGGLHGGNFFSSLLMERSLWLIGTLGGISLLGVALLVVRPRHFHAVAGIIPASLLLGVAVLSCASQGKYFIYHYGSLIAPTALLTGLVLSAMTRRSLVSLILIVGTWMAALSWNSQLTTERLLIAQSPHLKIPYWMSERFVRADFSLREQLGVSAWASGQLQEEDALFVWGFDPLINFMAERKNPTKFIYNFPFRMPHDQSLEQELISELNRTTPRAIIIGSRDSTPWVTGSNQDSAQLLVNIAGLREFVSRNYELNTRIGRFSIFVRRPN